MSAPTILITNGGPHPPELWAQTTVDQIIAVSPVAGLAAATFREHLIDVLTVAHSAVQLDWRNCDPGAYVKATAAEITEAAKGYPYHAHFAKRETLQYLHQLLTEHFNTVIDIERQWAAARRTTRT